MTAFLSQTLVPALFNMSLTGGIVILCVIVARLALKRAPKVFSYALWAVVLFRLLCPVSLSSGISLLGALDAPAKQASPVVSTVNYVRPQQQEALPQTRPQTAEPDTPASDPVAPVIPVEQEQQTAPGVDWATVAAWVWLAGAVSMAGYSVFALFRLRRRLVGSLRLRENLYLADHISTPFVLGLIRPRIYLPSALTEGEMGYIIRHEQYHIRHGDHVVKVVAFAALCLHWFNPLVWVAFVLAGRDMEMRCDEAVVKELGENVKADYSASLLALATGRLTIAGTPLAFGEGNPKGRIRNLLRWKRPRVWLSLAAGVVCVAVIAACAANPAGQNSQPPAGSSGEYQSMEDFARQTMAGAKEVTYHTASGEEATAQVTGTKLAWLEKQGQVEELAPQGTLEAWTFNYLVQIDVPTEEVALVGGMSEEDGWFDLEGQGGHNIVALRYPDGTYDVLYDQPVNDNLDFYGYHNSYEEAIYDWYVADQGLDLPLYVEDWSDQITYPVEGSAPSNYPVHRYDGHGWYLYIPVSGWTQRTAGDTNWFWTCDYCSGFTLTVDYVKTNLADYLAEDTQGMAPADSSGRVFTVQGDSWLRRCYYVEAVDGGCWKVTIKWTDSSLSEHPPATFADPGPMAPIERQVMVLMAESFTPDNRITPAEQDSVLENAQRTLCQQMEQGDSRLEVATGQEVRPLTAGVIEQGWLKTMGEDMLWQEDFPEGFYALPGSLSLVMDEENFFCFTPGGEVGQIMIDYMQNGTTNSWWTEDVQFYLWLTAVLEVQDVEMHDLDEDGIYEAVAWPMGEKKNLIIYDFYGDEIHRMDIVQQLEAEYADYTGLIGNIQREYNNMVQARVDGEDGVYRYKDGTLTYVCTLEEALLKT